MQRFSSRLFRHSSPPVDARRLAASILPVAATSAYHQVRIQSLRSAATAAATPQRSATHRNDEEELVRVMTSNPKHVARRVRQQMMVARKRITQFRNTVTYLMIILQGKLHKGELSPADAALVIEGIMAECVLLRQADMAHLLFRAGLRFRKFEVKLSLASLRHLFDCYRGTEAIELMKQLGNEIKSDPDESLRPIAIAAFLFAGAPNEAEAIRQGSKRLNEADYIALIEGYSKLGATDTVEGLITEVRQSSRDDLSADVAISTAITVAGDMGNADALQTLYVAALEDGVTLTDAALAALCRQKLKATKNLSDVYDVEKTLLTDLKIKQLCLGAATAIIERAAFFIGERMHQADSAVLVKVNHLRDIIETAIDNSEADSLDASYAIAALRGYGALNKHSEMMDLFKRLKSETALIDHKGYEEVIRWQSQSSNVKAVLALKAEMEKEHVHHTPRVYAYVLKSLGRFYPNLTEKYFLEAQQAVKSFDANLYAESIKAFAAIGDLEKVKTIYGSMLRDASKGYNVMSSRSVSALMRAFHKDSEVFDSLLSEATRRSLLGHEALQRQIVSCYAAQDRFGELEEFVSSLPRKGGVFETLLRTYSQSNRKAEFDRTLTEMKDADVQLGDRVYSIIISTYVRWGEKDKFKDALAQAQSVVATRNSHFYYNLAFAHARLGDTDAIDTIWQQMVDSGVHIEMDVFNKFLELYVHNNNVSRMQVVLQTMMRTVPPNPVTATTVVDMLGKMGRLQEMEVLIDEMLKTQNVQPTLQTYNFALNAYAKTGDITKIELLRNRMRQSAVGENISTFNILLDGYGRAQRYEQIPELMTERASKGVPMDDVGFEILLNLYGRARMLTEIESTVAAIMDRPAAQGQKTRSVSQASLSPRLLCAISTAFSYVNEVTKVDHFAGLAEAHVDCSDTTIETLMLVYHRLRDTARIDRLLQNHNTNEFMLNIAVSAFAKTGHYDRVSELLVEMDAKKMPLGSNTAVVLSSLLLKAGKVELAQVVLNWKRKAKLSREN